MSLFDSHTSINEVREDPSIFSEMEIYYFKNASITQNMDVVYENGKAFNNHILKGIIGQYIFNNIPKNSIQGTEGITDGCGLILDNQRIVGALLQQEDLDTIKKMHKVFKDIAMDHKNYFHLNRVQQLVNLFQQRVGDTESYLEKLVNLNKIANRNIHRVNSAISIGNCLLEKLTLKAQQNREQRFARSLARINFRQMKPFVPPLSPLKAEIVPPKSQRKTLRWFSNVKPRDDTFNFDSPPKRIIVKFVDDDSSCEHCRSNTKPKKNQ